MYNEITKEAFKALVNDASCDEVEQKETYCKMYYNVKGVTVIQIDNYNSFCTQYYIQDINA